jgi:hypothetical protein
LWLQAGVDLGVPGLVAYAGLWLGASAMLLRLWRSAGRAGPADAGLASLGRPLAVGLGGGLFAHFLFGFTDTVALGAKPGVLWWFLLGLIASLHARAGQAAG